MTAVNEQTLYTYKVIREICVNGQRTEQTRIISRTTPLKANELYKGSWRVLELVSAEPFMIKENRERKMTNNRVKKIERVL